MGSLEEDLERLVTTELGRAGWRVRRQPRGEQRIDALVERGQRRLAIEVRAARDSRTLHLQALLADAALRARRAALELGADPVAIVGAPRISDGVAAQVRAYADRYLEGTAHGIVDLGGRFEISGAGGDLPRRRGAPRGRALVEKPFEVFSDLNQWLLKVLLAPRLPADLLQASRHPVFNATRLAAAAGVSVPTTARLVAHLRAQGSLVASNEGLRLLDLGTLFDRWAAEYRKPPSELRCRFLLPKSDGVAQTLAAVRRHHASHDGESDGRICVGLFGAASALGFPHVTGVVPHVFYDGPSSRVCESLGLTAAGPGERVDVILVRPRFPESLFRGAVSRDDLPVTDVLQTWLDVANHPARGREQADHLWRHAIRGHLDGR